MAVTNLSLGDGIIGQRKRGAARFSRIMLLLMLPFAVGVVAGAV
jgi:putative effector of murein hydrolase LrgA (UPF0299 family)